MDNILALLPKIYFPNSVFSGEKSFLFFKSIESSKKLIAVSAGFKNSNAEMLENLFGPADYFIQDREPLVEDFNELKKICLDKKPDYLIAFGGGSVIDLAKLVKKELSIKMIAVPTTLGSGAEVSQHALLIDKQVKKIQSSSDFLPQTVILNPECLKSLSREQIEFQRIDALAHALESLVSRFANNLSESLSSAAAGILLKKDANLKDLQTGSVLAGLAQSSAGTGLAHALAHYFGPKNNIPHAKAVAVFLLDVLKLNSPYTEKLKPFIEKIGQIQQVKIEIKGDLEQMAGDIKRDVCCLTNPFQPSIEQIVEILKKHE